MLLFNVIMLSYNLDKYFFKLYRLGAFLNIILLIILLFIFNLSLVGAAVSLLVCETVITLYAVFIINKNNIKILTSHKINK